MRGIQVIFLFLLPGAVLSAQTPVGAWTDHLGCNNAQSIAISSAKVFVSTLQSIVTYDRQTAELKKISRTEGLNDTGINSIAWSEEGNCLIIGYLNTDIDLLQKNAIFNLPQILNTYISGEKTINRIRTGGRYAYIACSFGIVILDVIKKEIRDTWNPSSGNEKNEVWDVVLQGSTIYAATATGIFSADINDQGLSYSGNWVRNNSLPDPSGNYTTLACTVEKIFVNKSDPLAMGDSIFAIAPATAFISTSPGVINYSMDVSSDGFTVSSGSIIKYYSNSGALKKTITGYGFGIPSAMQSVVDNGDIWIADKNHGLVKGSGMSVFSALNIPGPLSSNTFFITASNGNTVVCGGGTDNSWNGLSRTYEVSGFYQNQWTNFTSGSAKDAVRALIDPGDVNHVFVSSWGAGLFEYSGNSLIKQYDNSNSPLQTATAGSQAVKVFGLAMDKNRYLWLTQSGVSGNIKVLKPDGNWISNFTSINVPLAGDIIITKSGYKWITLPGGYGIYILDDNETPSVTSDDRNKRILIKDTDSQIITSVYSIAEDLDGNIWIGTDQGPLVYYEPERIFDEDLNASRIKVPRNDGSGLSDYLLRTEKIMSIAVDGSNNKWLGTSGSGAYYVSSDGTTQIKSFNVLNSPILSDTINSIAIDNKTGNIWFGTPEGLQSYRGLATEGGEKFSHVYAFPNPVREDYTGSVTITGLIKDTNIKITDISGNLVFETTSEGGQAAWDLRTYNGKYVTTGVYLIFCASSDGSQSCVTKMLVIRK